MSDQQETTAKAATPKERKSQTREIYPPDVEREQWLRMLIDTAEEYAIFAVNTEGKICTWNKGAQNLFGYKEEEILWKDFSIIFTPEDRKTGVPSLEVETALKQGYCPDERWHLRKDGTRLFVAGAVRPLRDNQNKVRGFLKVAHDITKTNAAEELQAQFRALFESAPGLYLVLTPDLRIIAASDAYLRSTMTEREKVVGRGLFEVFPDEPGNPKCDGNRNLQASCDRVVRERRQDVMPVQYYPIPRPKSWAVDLKNVGGVRQIHRFLGKTVRSRTSSTALRMSLLLSAACKRRAIRKG